MDVSNANPSDIGDDLRIARNTLVHDEQVGPWPDTTLQQGVLACEQARPRQVRVVPGHYHAGRQAVLLRLTVGLQDKLAPVAQEQRPVALLVGPTH